MWLAINYHYHYNLCSNFMNFEDIFTFNNMYKSAKKCCNGVRWKSSTQNFENRMLTIVTKLKRQVLNNTFKSKGFHEFIEMERGKKRMIKSVHITERVVQKCLCDYCLSPIFTKKFIYDNGACIKGKGVGFAIRRLKTHLHRYWLQNRSNDGYILIFDIKSFFDNINHERLKSILIDYLDERTYNLYSYLIDCFGGENGLGLGSQISQVSAGIYLSELDHYLKDQLKIKFYGRYMDDGYVICKSKEELKLIHELIIQKLSDVKLNISVKKTHIIALKHGFTFLKRRFFLRDNGKLTTRPYKENIRRYRRKYKKAKNKDVLTQVFVGYLKEFNYQDRYTRRIKKCID